MIELLLSLTFGCGVFIAAAHVWNRAFIAPTYDVVANLTAFVSSTIASVLLHAYIAAALAAAAVACWVLLARRSAAAPSSRRTGMPGPLTHHEGT